LPLLSLLLSFIFLSLQQLLLPLLLSFIFLSLQQLLLLLLGCIGPKPCWLNLLLLLCCWPHAPAHTTPCCPAA